MGGMYFAGFLEAGVRDIEQLVGVQLQGNHYPPVPKIMNPMVVRAMKKAIAGDYEAKVRMPQGVQFRGQGGTVRVVDVIENYRLWDAVECLAAEASGEAYFDGES